MNQAVRDGSQTMINQIRRGLNVVNAVTVMTVMIVMTVMTLS